MAAASGPVIVGLFGSKGNQLQKVPDNTVPVRLRTLDVYIADNTAIVNGVEFTYDDQITSKQISSKYGSLVGTKKNLFNLADDVSDYVVNLYGKIGNTYVNCLGVNTHNDPKGRQVGKNEGTSFEIPLASGTIVALFGSTDGIAMTGVGAYLGPPPPTNARP